MGDWLKAELRVEDIYGCPEEGDLWKTWGNIWSNRVVIIRGFRSTPDGTLIDSYFSTTRHKGYKVAISVRLENIRTGEKNYMILRRFKDSPDFLEWLIEIYKNFPDQKYFMVKRDSADKIIDWKVDRR